MIPERESLRKEEKGNPLLFLLNMVSDGICSRSKGSGSGSIQKADIEYICCAEFFQILLKI